MPVLSPGAIADVAYSAGFRGNALETIVAIALAESGGNSGAKGDINLTTGGEVSVGLWQINWRPAYASDPTRNREANLDPATAARNAYTISRGGTKFRDWSMYTNGGYRAFLSKASAAASDVSSRGGALTPPASPTTQTERGTVFAGPADPRIPGGGFPASGTSADVGLPEPGQLLPSVYVAPTSIEHILLSGFGDDDNPTEERLSARVTGGEMSMSVSEVSQLTLSLVDPDRHLGRKGLLRNGAPLVWARPGVTKDAKGTKGGPWDGQLAAHEIENDDPLTWKITSRSVGAQLMRHGKLDVTALERNTVFAGPADPGTPGGGFPATGKNMSLSEYAALLAKAAGLEFTGQGLPRLGDIAPDVSASPPESAWDVLQRVAADQGVWAWEAAGHLYVGRPSWLIDRLVTVPVTVETGRPTDCIGLPRPRESIDAADGAVTLDLNLPRWRGELVRPGMTLAVTWPDWLSNYPDGYLVASVSWPVDGGIAPVAVSCVEPVDPPVKESPAAMVGGQNDTPTGPSGTTPPPVVTEEKASARPSAASSAGVIWPLAGRVSGFFGDPRPGHKHQGIDIVVPVGVPCKAVFAGKVTRINGGPASTAGLYMEITRDDGLMARYLHLSKTAAKVGDQVSQGEVICYSGNTGITSTGPHLHFELVPGHGAAVDPLTLLPKL